MKKLFAFLSGLFLLTSCSTPLSFYKDQKPLLKMEEFFNGDLEAEGMFKGRDGSVTRRFTVKMKGTWKDNIGTLEEDFIYADGQKQRRVWTITKLPDNKYTGTASDVFDQAEGAVSGNALRWNYYMDLNVDGKHYKVYFDDWMYLIDENHLLNISYMSKWNFNLGEVFLSIRKIKR